MSELGNTEESKKLRIVKENPYWTVAYQDVCGAVDREIEYREKLEIIARRNDPRPNGGTHSTEARAEQAALYEEVARNVLNEKNP